GAFWILHAGQFDDDPVAPDLLNHRLGDPEFVDALPEHGQRQVNVATYIRRDALGLVELKTQVHTALEVEAALEWHPPHLHVLHDAIGITLAQVHGAWEQRDDRAEHEHGDQNHTIANRCKHRHSDARTGASRSGC